jgi:hypothetical protein
MPKGTMKTLGGTIQPRYNLVQTRVSQAPRAPAVPRLKEPKNGKEARAASAPQAQKEVASPMPLKGVRYRYKPGTNVRLAFRGNKVVEAKNTATGATHTPAEFAMARRNKLGRAKRAMRDRSTMGSPPMEHPDFRRGYRPC